MAGWLGLALCGLVFAGIILFDPVTLLGMPGAGSELAFAGMLLCLAAIASVLGLLSPSWSVSRQAAIWGSVAVAVITIGSNMNLLRSSAIEYAAVGADKTSDAPKARPAPVHSFKKPEVQFERWKPHSRIGGDDDEGANGYFFSGGPNPFERAKAVVEISAGGHGHFIATADIDNTPIKVLIDTGASAVALSYEDAEAAGLRPFSLDFTIPVSTANGIAHAAPVTLRQVEIDNVRVRDVRGMVMPKGAMRGTLLGMSFLGRLRSFRVEGGVLRLED